MRSTVGSWVSGEDDDCVGDGSGGGEIMLEAPGITLSRAENADWRISPGKEETCRIDNRIIKGFQTCQGLCLLAALPVNICSYHQTK